MRSKYIASGGGELLSFGRYEDTCVNTDAGWRIAEKRVIRALSFKGMTGEVIT